MTVFDGGYSRILNYKSFYMGGLWPSFIRELLGLFQNMKARSGLPVSSLLRAFTFPSRTCLVRSHKQRALTCLTIQF